MARVPLVQDDDEAARATGLFDTFKHEGRPPSDIFRALANVPGLMTAHRALPQALRAREHCPPRLRELAVLRLAQLAGSAYEWSHHRPMALDAGVTADQAAALSGLARFAHRQSRHPPRPPPRPVTGPIPRASLLLRVTRSP